MKNLQALLQKACEDFGLVQEDFEKQKEKVKNIQSLQDLEALNGKDQTNYRLGQLSVGPNINAIGLERLIGANNLMDIYYLQRGLDVAKTVCRIVMVSSSKKTPIGTGFMVGPGLMMTNNHVIETSTDSKYLSAEFEYEKGANGINSQTYFFNFDPEAFFITNAKLDYTIIAVEPLASNDPGKKLEDYGWNKLAPSKEKVLVGEPLTIIQHPEGLPKMIAFRENKMVSMEGDLVHYTTDTQPGSSGSLVANDNWEIVALHRSGVPQKDEDDNILLTKGGVWQDSSDTPFISWIANQGVLMDSILADVAGRVPVGSRAELKAHLMELYQPVGEHAEISSYRLPKKK